MGPSNEASGPARACLRVLLADASEMARQQLRAELASLPFVKLLGEADTADEVLTLFFQVRPDVVLVSTVLPDQGGYEVLQCIVRAASESTVILLSNSSNPFTVATARMLGAAGVFAASDDSGQLHEMLQNLWDRRLTGKSL